MGRKALNNAQVKGPDLSYLLATACAKMWIYG